MLEIVWSGDPRPEFEDRIRAEVQDLMANGLSHIDDLIVHLIEIGDLEDGPLIEIDGWGGKIHARYTDKPEWVTLKEPN